jgi:L-ascorbate metabolism protein UlaG (beta-lactamase superfamily)
MRITHLGHAAVLVETDRERMLIDPGAIDAGWRELTDLDAILITHLHADHLDPAGVPELLAANPGARVIVEPSIVRQAGQEVPGVGTLPALPGATGLAPGDKINFGSVDVTAVGGEHAVIHADLPRLGNVGYLISAEGQPTFFHPGDSYGYIPEGVDVLAIPAYGPWAALKETIDFVRDVGANRGFPIHDGLLRDNGRDLIIGRLNAMTQTEVVDLRGAGPHTF